jgi:hypothetical protein
MRKNEINGLFRNYVREHLSPKPEERDFVSSVYESVQDVLGTANCFQIGSYPRFTSISPLHDLDVLYILGDFDKNSSHPSQALNDLESQLKSNYKNPTRYSVEVSRQTHSITLTFSEGRAEFFSVDIVPAYKVGKNEFNDDTYLVPEIASKAHSERRVINAEISKGTRAMAWINSDPRGYITVASQLNQQNDDFRKAVKLVKGWRASCKEANEEFPLKSFHLEQAITRNFQQNPEQEIFDAVFNFFFNLSKLIERAQIPDRADPAKKIDAYIDGLTKGEKAWILKARDFFLIKLEEIAEGADINDLLEAGLHERGSDTEAYLFDQNIPMLTEDDFGIVGNVLPRAGGFRSMILDAFGIIEVDRKIEFLLGSDAPAADIYKWKVKNDNSSPQRRGEITDHGTLRNPEETKYSGSHYVECFAIRNGVCIGRSRQNVVLKRIW